MKATNFKMKNLMVIIGMLFLFLGLICLYWSITIPAFTNQTEAESLFMMGWEEYKSLSAQNNNFEIWESRMDNLRTIKFILLDWSLVFTGISILCFAVLPTVKKRRFSVPANWIIIFSGVVGYMLLIYQIVYDLNSEFTRYPQPFFMDAHIKAVSGIFYPLIIFSIVIVVTGIMLLRGKNYRGEIIFKTRRRKGASNFLLSIIFVIMVIGLIVSMISGPMAFATIAFLIWIWVILCTRSVYLAKHNL